MKHLVISNNYQCDSQKSTLGLGNFGHRVNFGHTYANSGNPDETAPYEPSHQDFHCLLS